MAKKVELQTLIDRSIIKMGSGIHNVVKESAIEMIKRAYAEGIFVRITSGYRSTSEQNKLYAQGRTTPGKIVTNAKGGQSNHNYGLAIDYVLLSEDGKKASWTVNDKWRRVASIGKSLGFSWGGEWESFKDYPHLEMMGGLTLSQLQAGKHPVLVSLISNKMSVANPVPVTTESKISTSTSSKSSGDAKIKAIQKKLNTLYKTGLVVDGFYGPKTKKALITGLQTELNKQYFAGLVVDGLYGPATKAALVNVKKPSEGNITYILQAFVYINGYDTNGMMEMETTWDKLLK